jgi:hypothetical protein
VRRNALTIFRVWAQYEPLKLFWGGALILGIPALALFIRFLVLFIAHGGRAGHVQSLLLGAVLFIAAMLLGALGVIGDLLATQRTLSQRTFERVRRIELQLGIEPSHYEPGGPTRPADGDATSAGDAPARPADGDATSAGDAPDPDRRALEV